MSTMKYIQLEPIGDIAIIKINRPDALNAVNTDVIAELSRTIDIVSSDDGIKARNHYGCWRKIFLCRGRYCVYGQY